MCLFVSGIQALLTGAEVTCALYLYLGPPFGMRAKHFYFLFFLPIIRVIHES